MRTTLTLSSDVFEEARRTADSSGRSFKDVVNDALRLGLASMKESKPAKPYRVVPKAMGLRKGMSYDKVSELLARAEGEGFERSRTRKAGMPLNTKPCSGQARPKASDRRSRS